MRVPRPVDETAYVALRDWRHPEPFDLGVPLLNWSLELATGRYFTCLDLVDLLLPGACAKLPARLRATPAALALGGVTTRKMCWECGRCSVGRSDPVAGIQFGRGRS